MDKDISGVAFHEAGHAVIASSRCFAVLSVSIEMNVQEERWDGATERPAGTYSLNGVENGKFFVDITGPLNEIAIACAGFLAQARHVALGKTDKCYFAKEQEWNSFLAWMADRNPQVQPTYLLKFETDNRAQDIIVEIQPRWFGGIDRTVYLREVGVIAATPFVTTMNEYLRETITEVMSALDEEPVWTKVYNVAHILITRCDGVTSSLNAHEYAEAIKADERR